MSERERQRERQRERESERLRQVSANGYALKRMLNDCFEDLNKIHLSYDSDTGKATMNSEAFLRIGKYVERSRSYLFPTKDFIPWIYLIEQRKKERKKERKTNK
jgi:hypothetical protein